MTVGSILKKPKDKFSKDLSTGVIYKISCKDCDKVYVLARLLASGNRAGSVTGQIFSFYGKFQIKLLSLTKKLFYKNVSVKIL